MEVSVGATFIYTSVTRISILVLLIGLLVLVLVLVLVLLVVLIRLPQKTVGRVARTNVFQKPYFG